MKIINRNLSGNSCPDTLISVADYTTGWARVFFKKGYGYLKQELYGQQQNNRIAIIRN